MIRIEKKSKCSGCYACAASCPKKCIKLKVDAEGFWYPDVDESLCINCGACEKVCPILAPSKKQSDWNITTYATMHNEDSIRLASSSGGVFSALAGYVLDQGGVVFGASFDSDLNVEHKYIECIEDLEFLRGSKYVQSKIGDAYCRAEAFLKAGRLVLFSGTPCQIEGLLSYLKRPYENLITQDLICHGVPSPAVWQKYIDYLSTSFDGTKPVCVSFRSKTNGWKNYYISIIFGNGKEYSASKDTDPMMQAFLKNLCLRPSCYECAFKTKSRRSDITLADFWGVSSISPDLDDDKGTSLVIIQSEKGAKVFDKIRDIIYAKETDPDLSTFYNSSIIKSPKEPKKRAVFMRAVSAENFAEIQKKYSKPTMSEKVKSFLIRALGKVKRMVFKKPK